MMKKTILIAAAVAAISGCNFLDESNPTGLQTIYDTEDMLESAIYGIVSGFASSDNGVSGSPQEGFGCSSGILHWGSLGSSKFTDQQYECSLRFAQYSTNYRNVYLFRQLYMPINRANTLLASLEDSPVDEAYKEEIAGEATFYRAVAYYWIVRIWGDCPLRLAVDTDQTALKCPRTPYYEVYRQIIEDFGYAFEHMRTPERVKEVTPDMPRPDKYAAIAYLSSVYTTIGSLLASPDDNFWDSSKEERKPDFSAIGLDKDNLEEASKQAYRKALEYCRKLIPGEDGYDSGCRYALLTKHSDLFTFDASFSRDGYTSWIHPEQVFTIPTTIVGGISTGYAKLQLPDFPEGTSATITNNVYGRIRPTRWMFQKWCETYPGEMATGGKIYATSSDPRLDATFYYNRMKYCNGGGLLTCYPTYTNCNSRESSYPYFRKNASKRYNVNMSDADVYMMRFAEVYLNAAEAAAYLDDETSARKYLDVIHERARNSVPDGADASLQPDWSERVFADKEELMTAIFWERIFELTGETFEEYFETHRHGARWIIRNICIPKNAFLAQPENELLHGYAYPDSTWSYPKDYEGDPDESSSDVFMIRKGLLAAFPENEFLFNTGISASTDKNDYTY